MSKKFKKGFTIVELLIVIVVMGILAAIVIVTYQGVQDKANTTKNQSNAKEVVGKAEAYSSLNTSLYPDGVDIFFADDADSSVAIKNAELEALLLDGPATAFTNETRKNIYYSVCTDEGNDTGIRVEYWDYDKKESTKIDSGTCGAYTPLRLQ